VWVLGLFLAGCTVLPVPPSLPTPIRPPEVSSAADALQAAASGEFPLQALTIRYTIGNPGWDGQTTLTISDGGAVQVTFARGQEHGAWQSSLTDAEMLGLVRLMADQKLWAIRGQRQIGVPDETYPTVTVEVAGLEPLSVGMWYGEAVDHPDFGPIVDALAGLARQVSGGVAR